MLEAWVGAPLFNRGTHRIELTPAGDQWRHVAEDALRRIYLGREHVRDAAMASTSTLKFASTHALSVLFFPDWYQKLEADNALGASVSLTTDSMAACEQKMIQGHAHFLLCHHHPSAPISFKPNYFLSTTIGHDTLVPVSAPDDTQKSPRFALPAMAEAPVPHLAYSDVSGMGRILSATLANDRPPVWLFPAFTAHVATVLAMMARAGRGVAWLPLSLIKGDLEARSLLRAGDERWDVAIDIRLYRPRARQNPVAEKFWTVVQAHSSASVNS